jgi:hypothetical protein
VRRFLQIVCVLLLISTGATMWYLYRKGFTKPWREWLVDELRRRGVEVTFSKLTLEPFRGLVAKDVKVFQNSARKRVIAKVDEVVVEANYAHAARGEPFLNALTLVDASLELPLDPKRPSGPSLKVERLNTRLHLPPKQLLVARLEAEISGVRVKAAGQLANPFYTKPTQATSPPAPGSSPLHRVLEELRQLSYEGRKPELTVRFSGDVSRPETLIVEADLIGTKIRRGGYLLEELHVSGSWQNQSLVIPQFDARDAVGRLQLSASYQATTGQAECRVRSGMNLPALLRATQLTDFGEFKFESVPALEATARATLPDKGRPLSFQVLGHVRVGRCQYGKTPLQRLNGDFSWDGKRWALRDVLIQHANGGELRLNAQQDFNAAGVGDFRLGLQSNLNPETLAPLLEAKFKEGAKRLAQFKFHDAPKISLSARGPSPLDCAASGELKLGRTSYRNVEALDAHANLRYNGRVLSIDDFTLRRAEGVGGGSIAFDFDDGLVDIRNVRCALYPVEAALWIDPDLVGDIRPYRLQKQPPSLVINGQVDLRRPPARTRLDIGLDAPRLDYTFCGKELQFTNVTGKLNFADARMRMTDIRAELFGGTMKGDADISLLKAKPGHAARLEFGDIDFSKLTKLYFDYDESQGKLNGHFNFTGAGDDGRAMRGQGYLLVEDGHVFAIPFLGPFSEILNKLVPGMGYHKARQASANFTMADGMIHTDDFVIEGKGFSMIGDGMIGFLDDRMDFDMRLNARGLPGVLLFPMSKLLEYETRGKFSKPNWRAKIIPKFGGNNEERSNSRRVPAESRRSAETPEPKKNRPRETNSRGR